MLALYGLDEIIRNLYRLAMVQAPESNVDTTEDVRSVYLDFLEARQPWAPVNRSDDVFITAVAVEDKLSAAFSEGALDDLGQADVFGGAYAHDVRQAKLSSAREALVRVSSLDEELGLVFGMVIHSVFVRASKPAGTSKGSHGGSSSASLGSIWLTVNDGVRELDLMEMYVHELTHHLIFLDELNHAQFMYHEIAKPENFAHSAILKKHRPLDKVIHSIIVAVEILAARETFLASSTASTIHPTTRELEHETIAAIESVYELDNLDELITDHMRTILDDCSSRIRSNVSV